MNNNRKFVLGGLESILRASVTRGYNFIKKGSTSPIYPLKMPVMAIQVEVGRF